MRRKQCRRTDIHHCLARRLKKVASHIIEFEVNVAHLFAMCG